jgi:hypothetical protein
MRRRQSLVLPLIAVTLLAGCGSNHAATGPASPSTPTVLGAATPSAPVQVPGTTGYLGTSPTSVTHLQWQPQSDGTFTGTALGAEATGNPPDETVNPGTTPINGQINGIALALDIDGHTDQGVLSGGTLTINVIQTDGSIRPITYHQASSADYNAALLHLQQWVQAADGQAQTQQANASAQTGAQNALSQLQSDNQAFTNAQSVRGDLAKADQDLKSEKQDAANGNGDNCYNVDTNVSYDATTNVGYDVTTDGAYDVTKEQDAVNSVGSHIQAVQSAEAALKAASLPPTPGASAAIATAQRQDAQAVATTNQAVDSMNADLAEAYSIANAAGTGDCAGHGPGSPPAGLSHIS